jgi:hypothetical protein
VTNHALITVCGVAWRPTFLGWSSLRLFLCGLTLMPETFSHNPYPPRETSLRWNYSQVSISTGWTGTVLIAGRSEVPLRGRAICRSGR